MISLKRFAIPDEILKSMYNLSKVISGNSKVDPSTETEGTAAAAAEPARDRVSTHHQVRHPRAGREPGGVEGVQGGEGGAVLEQLHRRGHQQEQAGAPRQRQEPGMFTSICLHFSCLFTFQLFVYIFSCLFTFQKLLFSSFMYKGCKKEHVRQCLGFCTPDL